MIIAENNKPMKELGWTKMNHLGSIEPHSHNQIGEINYQLQKQMMVHGKIFKNPKMPIKKFKFFLILSKIYC